jgi:hypothetical protein
MSDVRRNREKKTNRTVCTEIDEFRHFHHDRSFGRCPECGRMVFLPCLACLTEIEGEVNDPFETEKTEQDLLRIQLSGRERQRYEHFHLKKVTNANQEELEKT